MTPKSIMWDRYAFAQGGSVLPEHLEALGNQDKASADQLPFLPLCFVINLNVSLWDAVMVNKVLCKIVNHSTLNQDLILPLLT